MKHNNTLMMKCKKPDEMTSNPLIFKDIKAQSLLFDHVYVKYYIIIVKKNCFQCKLIDIILFKLNIDSFIKHYSDKQSKTELKRILHYYRFCFVLRNVFKYKYYYSNM